MKASYDCARRDQHASDLRKKLQSVKIEAGFDRIPEEK
jgi:hypothetical protein